MWGQPWRIYTCIILVKGKKKDFLLKKWEGWGILKNGGDYERIKKPDGLWIQKILKRRSVWIALAYLLAWTLLSGFPIGNYYREGEAVASMLVNYMPACAMYPRGITDSWLFCRQPLFLFFPYYPGGISGLYGLFGRMGLLLLPKAFRVKGKYLPSVRLPLFVKQYSQKNILCQTLRYLARVILEIQIVTPGCRYRLPRGWDLSLRTVWGQF